MVSSLVVALYAALAAPAEYVPEPEPCPSDLVVGCYYFPGHFAAPRWMPMRDARYPLPLLGYYRDGEPEVSDWHIKWAVEHGIDFFAFDYYHHYENGPNTGHNLALDQGFLEARYCDKMDFCLMWCNEGGEERYTEDHLLALARILTDRYFSRPNHLRIDGDNVLIVSRPDHFLASFGVEGTARVFEQMAQVSREAGHGGLFPVAKGHNDQAKLKAAGFRAITAYNYPTAGMSAEQREANRAPYADMVRGIEAIWKQVTDVGVLPYIVPVSPGWDSRPWYGDRALVRTNPSPRLYYEMCEAAKQYVDPELRMVIAECWNEFGEGSYIEPTVQYGFGWLDAMRDAFCPDNPHHTDVVPASVGREAPAFTAIPKSADELIATGANMMEPGDMEGQWDWVSFAGGTLEKASGAHGGDWCLLVPAGQGVKSQWLMPAAKGRPIRVTFWYRIPEGAALTAKAALFQQSRWLGKYREFGVLAPGNGDWQQFDALFSITDAEATHFDIEFVAAGGDCRVDDIAVRVEPPGPPEEVLIPSSADGSEQSALIWVPPAAQPGADGPPVPLLVSLHSWSAGRGAYDSYAGALEGCRQRGWVFLSPEFRGPNRQPEACASELAVQDILDAVAYARAHARVDERRIYVLGGSGGGHIALVMAHRAPKLWAAVSAWVPVTDLAAWHAFCQESGFKYAGDIESCLGGPPGDADRDEEYRKRSPLFWLEHARGLPIDIQTGIHDGHDGRAIPIDHSLRAFNALARANGHADAALTDEEVAFMTREQAVPEHLAAERTDEAGREHAIVFRRTAGPVRLTLFDGGHVIDPPPALDWLASQAKP
ncbi:MAG: glycoside hydrolase family 99-like domain-containing protein [Candidatus Hydrogenedentes bacterium]|nr:glycoside hydrolase family 99-like domain-containing protein [Candidatus Hydrogenedentota bacterium]